MKLLVIGPQLSGKTTLVQYLRSNTAVSVYEVDEEILISNNNEWPTDNQYKDEVLVPEIYKSMAAKSNIIFFINSAFPPSILQQFKKNNFKIVLLRLSRDEIERRNSQRMEHEKYEDAMPWIDGQLANHDNLCEQGFIDQEIDASGSTESIAKVILRVQR